MVVGGLAAPRLALTPPVPHEGTTDVDLVLEVAMDYDLDESDYSWVEEALVRAGATPSRTGGAWRWVVEGVFIDLLCDRFPNEHHGEVSLPGAPRVVAMQVPGPAAAAVSPRRLPVDPSDPVSPMVLVADLGRQRQALMMLVNDALVLGESSEAYAETMSRLGSAESIDVLRQDTAAAALVLRRHLTRT